MNYNEAYCICIVGINKNSNTPKDVIGTYFSGTRVVSEEEVVFSEKKTDAAIYFGPGAVDEAKADCRFIKEFCSDLVCGIVRYEEKYPNILFAEDGNVFTIDEKRYLVIGGAYSVDKFYRLVRGFGWWADEQPSDAVKRRVEAVVAAQPVDYVLSHTCPFKYEPVEVFLPGIDQSTVDDSTERWLDEIEEKLDYTAWYCGHWHIDKRIDRMHFLFNSFENPEQDRGKGNE